MKNEIISQGGSIQVNIMYSGGYIYIYICNISCNVLILCTVVDRCIIQGFSFEIILTISLKIMVQSTRGLDNSCYQFIHLENQ